jgi:MFS transporter, DHA2 family, multidrug resistance protein
MRNMGSSVGTSMVTTLIERRSQVHQVYLASDVIAGRPGLATEVAGLTAHLAASGVNAERAATQAYAIVFRDVIAQATTLAYVDTFMVLAAAAAIMFVLSFGLKKNEPGRRRVVME